MRLATFDDDRIGVVVGDRIVDVTAAVPRSTGTSRMRQLVADHRTLLPTVRRLADEHASVPLSMVRLRAPIADPSKIVAAPVNYQDHQREMRVAGDVSALGFFLKSPASVLGPGGRVRLPYTDRRFDHEAEVAVVIGRTARDLDESNALDAVFGFTGLLDITMRGGEDRSIRKSFDTFTPIGPWLVTGDEIADPGDIEFTLWTNGEVRQQASTRSLIWSIARFVSYVSSVTTLEPGDIISTGTPAGVSPIHDGDTVALEVAPVGRLTVSVGAEDATRSPTLGHDGGPRPERNHIGAARFGVAAEHDDQE